MGKKKKGRQDNDDVAAEDADRRSRDRDERDERDDDDGVRRMLPEVIELAQRFGFPEEMAWKLHDVMDDRIDEYGNSLFREDMKMLHNKLEESPQPMMALIPLLKELSSGRFIAKAESHAEVQQFCRRHGLDRGASTKLVEAMHIRETKYGSNISQDLKILGAHLENSNAPSKLVSMKLKDIRAGYKLGNCVYARAKDIQIPAEEGGPSIEGSRSKKPPSGYTDHDLQQRFGASRSDGGGVTMTEEQARQFQKSMRMAEKKDKEKEKDEGSSRTKGRSRSRSKAKGRDREKARSRDRKRSRSRSRSKSKRKGRSRSRRR